MHGAVRLVVTGMLVAACNGSTPSATGDGEWPAPKPFQTADDRGNLVAIRLDRPENPRTDVFAMFGDDLQGFMNSAACATDFMPCVPAARRSPYGQVAFLSNSVFRPEATAFSWVGDEVLAGPVVTEFQHDTETGLAWYEGGTDARPSGSLRIRLGGEWADVEDTLGFFPPDFRVTEPDLEVDQRLDLSGAPVTFRWESLGGREIWLWVQGTTSRRLIRVPDTGSYTLDPLLLGLAPAERVEVGLTAVTTETLDVAGNPLDLLVLTGAGWTGSVCGDFLDIPVEVEVPIVDPMPAPTFMGYGFRGILDDGVRDFVDPTTGMPRSAELYFNFYDEDFRELCTIRYDASNAARRPPLRLDSGARQYATFNVALFDGESTCGRLEDPGAFGSTDLRRYVEQFDWSFSIGDITELEEPLRNAFGPDAWENQRQFMYAVFWSQDGLFGQERGWGFGTMTPQCFQGSNNTALFAPTDELEPGYYIGNPYFIDRVP
jgi:hypothetical protein